ncbi:MAG: hypothetical protein COB78_07715 [Hyphomicrobiales bacterium]|nr:MAG: hypothetical protein COB78_07715 [Hyphomicrobiales bacterium]
MRRIFASFLLIFSLHGASLNGAIAADKLVVEKLDADSYPAEIIVDPRELSENGLPDGRISTIKGDIVAAWYSRPTERYRHGILGDKIEAGSLKVKTHFGATLTYRLPRSEVFEDITPRLVDLDRNGKIEVVTIRSSVSKGAAITVYGLNGPLLVQKATTPFIGLSHRWLNIAGISNFSLGKTLEIAAVITPHIGGTLRFYKYNRGKLLQRAAASGFSNHVIGSREQRLSVVLDFDGNGTPDIALPSADRLSLYIMSLTENGMVLLAEAQLPSPINKAITLRGEGNSVQFIVGLEDESVYSVHR